MGNCALGKLFIRALRIGSLPETMESIGPYIPVMATAAQFPLPGLLGITPMTALGNTLGDISPPTLLGGI